MHRGLRSGSYLLVGIWETLTRRQLTCRDLFSRSEVRISREETYCKKYWCTGTLQKTGPPLVCQCPATPTKEGHKSVGLLLLFGRRAITRLEHQPRAIPGQAPIPHQDPLRGLIIVHLIRHCHNGFQGLDSPAGDYCPGSV